MSETQTATAAPAPATAREVVVKAVEVKKIYRMGDEEVHALRGVNLEIYRGEYLSIMGPSGSGKSTLFNMVGGLDTPSAGSVFISGNDISKLDKLQLAWLRCHKIGYIFQTYNILEVMTALENVMLPMTFKGLDTKQAQELAYEKLKLVGLNGREGHRPQELSGGQQQRVAIARALANNPDIILADEPTANLDTKTGAEIIELMEELKQKQKVTVISATHDHKMLKKSDRIVWIRDGRIDKIQLRENLRIEEGSIG